MITPYLVQCFIISFIVTNCFGFRNHSPYHVYHVYHAQCATTRKAQRWAYRSLTVPICQPLPSDSLMMTCVANCELQFLPSGKLLHNYRTSPFCIGKSTISRGIFNSQLLTEPRLGSCQDSDLTEPSTVSCWVCQGGHGSQQRNVDRREKDGFDEVPRGTHGERFIFRMCRS